MENELYELRAMSSEGDAPLANQCARRFCEYARKHFDPASDDSWTVLDKLWRAAVLSRTTAR